MNKTLCRPLTMYVHLLYLPKLTQSLQGKLLMNQRKFLRFLNKTLNDSRDAVIRYLTAELKFLIKHLEARPKPTECEKAALARAAKAIDPEHLEKTFNLFQPSTLLRWYRKLVAKKWDYSNRRKPGRPRVNRELEELVVQLALENPRWLRHITRSLKNSRF